jgi:hypothetical protein
MDNVLFHGDARWTMFSFMRAATVEQGQCPRAAEYHVWARHTMLSFMEMRDGMYGQSNESPNVAELQPAKGQPKGRPRKSQIARQVSAGLSMR